MMRLVIATLLLTAAPATFAKDKAAKTAAKHCGAALEHAALWEEAPLPDERAVQLCQDWYTANASDEQLEALVCMAKAGDEPAWQACRAPFIPSPVAAQPQLVIEVARAAPSVPQDPGVLGALADSSELDGVFGSSDLDLEGAIGGLIGSKGTAVGSGGLGSRGSGLGGLGTAGQGPSSGGSFGTSAGVMSTGDPIVLGALDKTLIDAVLERHMAQLRYCYIREQQDIPDLSGKIIVKFVIAKDGSVSSANTKSSTMNNGAVEQCLNSRFMRFQFPLPKGGGIVIVSYPFIFSPEPAD